MKPVDLIALVLLALLAWRAFARARKLNREGCAGGCVGCQQAGSCALPQAEESKLEYPQ